MERAMPVEELPRFGEDQMNSSATRAYCLYGEAHWVDQEPFQLGYFPAQNSTPLAFDENHPVGGKLRDRTELNLTLAAAADSFL
jgi:hypothetical protein